MKSVGQESDRNRTGVGQEVRRGGSRQKPITVEIQELRAPENGGKPPDDWDDGLGDPMGGAKPSKPAAT